MYLNVQGSLMFGKTKSTKWLKLENYTYMDYAVQDENMDCNGKTLYPHKDEKKEIFDDEVNKVSKYASRSWWRDIINEVRKLKDQGGIEQSQFKELTDLLIPIVLNPCPDRWFWSLEGSGEFSVASIRRFIDDQRLLTVDSKTLWIKSVPIKAGDVGNSWRTIDDFEDTWPRSGYVNSRSRGYVHGAKFVVDASKPVHGRLRSWIHGWWAEQVLDQWTLCKGKSVPTKDFFPSFKVIHQDYEDIQSMLFDDYKTLQMELIIDHGAVDTVRLFNEFGQELDGEHNQKVSMEIAKLALWYDSCRDSGFSDVKAFENSLKITGFSKEKEDVGEICVICNEEYKVGEMTATMECEEHLFSSNKLHAILINSLLSLLALVIFASRTENQDAIDALELLLILKRLLSHPRRIMEKKRRWALA
ncbi:hypothetical protein Tco_0408982 [Tanacetum coccineum]